MTSEELLAQVDGATQRFADSVLSLAPAALREPCNLPQWTRAHLLSHVARNADGLRNLLLAARTGESVRTYASPSARAADIDAGATRPAEVVIADAVESSRRFLVEARAMPHEAWHAEVAFTSGQPSPPQVTAVSVLEMRLDEVEIHHVDLNAGYLFEMIPVSSSLLLLERYVHRHRRSGLTQAVVPTDAARFDTVDAGERIEGTSAELLAWLTGRGQPTTLRSKSGTIPLLASLG